MALYTNEDWNLRFVQFKNANGTPFPLTGKSFVMEIKLRADDAEPFFTASTDDGSLVIEGDDDEFLRFVVPVAGRPGFEEASYYYDILRVDGGRKRYCGGRMNVKMGITQA